MLAVKTEGLTKNYGKYPGISDVNLTVAAGDFFGLIGDRGAGKTTVLKLLMNYIFPTTGSGNIFGYDIAKDASVIKKSTCYVPTDPFYYPKMKARKIIETTAKCHQIFDRQSIDELMDYFEVENIKVDDMSASEKKMVAFVSAFACDPSLLLIDDITRNLDTSMRNRLYDLLRQRNREGMTILLTGTEFTDVQELCTNVAYLKDGTIAEVENLTEINTYHKVIRFKIKGFHRDEFQALGAEILNETGDSLRLAYPGDLTHLAQLLRSLDVREIDFNNADLQDRFMAIYQATEEEQADDHL